MHVRSRNGCTLKTIEDIWRLEKLQMVVLPHATRFWRPRSNSMFDWITGNVLHTHEIERSAQIVAPHINRRALIEQQGDGRLTPMVVGSLS